MAKILGRIGKIAVSTDGGSVYNDINGLVDGTLNASQAEVTVTSHDDGAFETYLAGRHDFTIDGSFRYDEADTGLDNTITSFINGTTLDYRFRMRGDTSGADEWKAQGIVTASNEAMPNDDAAMVDITIRLTGTVTRSAQP